MQTTAVAVCNSIRISTRSQGSPGRTSPGDGPPAPAKWASRDPAAAARLQAARIGLAELSERVGTPVENLLSPDTVRRVLWSPPDGDAAESIASVLAARGARPWQVELTVPVLTAALDAPVISQVTRQ